LGAEDGEQQDAGGPDRPEGPRVAGEEDSEVPGDGQLQIHECLDLAAAEIEDPFPEVEEPERGDDAGDTEHG